MLIPLLILIVISIISYYTYRQLRNNSRKKQQEKSSLLEQKHNVPELSHKQLIRYISNIYQHLGFQTYIQSYESTAPYHLVLFKNTRKYLVCCLPPKTQAASQHILPLLASINPTGADELIAISNSFNSSALNLQTGYPLSLVEPQSLSQLADEAFSLK